jgi:hypothetical protein
MNIWSGAIALADQSLLQGKASRDGPKLLANHTQTFS